MLDGSVPMALGDSVLLSGIGMLVVFMELILLAVMIVIVSKIVRNLTDKNAAATAPAPTAVTPIPTPAPVVVAPAPVPVAIAASTTYACRGALTLTDIDEPTAATAMAVVSHMSGIPLNHLDFHSIKGVVKLDGVEERDAAVIMALMAYKLQKPVNKLIFKSIKKVK